MAQEMNPRVRPAGTLRHEGDNAPPIQSTPRGRKTAGAPRFGGAPHGPWQHPALAPAAQQAKDVVTAMRMAFARGERSYRGLPLAPLFEPAGGKMMGVMRARPKAGGPEHLHFAFSGQLRGRWIYPGWAGPLFDVAAWHAAERSGDPPIQALTAQIDRMDPGDPQRRARILRRRELSLRLLDTYLELYRVPTLNGAVVGLRDCFGGARPPTGAGDCCAPKLLAVAIRQGLEVLGVSEVFVGSAQPGKGRACGEIYAPCLARCAPILDVMLRPAPTEPSRG